MWYLAASLHHAAERFSVPSPAPIQAICWPVMCNRPWIQRCAGIINRLGTNSRGRQTWSPEVVLGTRRVQMRMLQSLSFVLLDRSMVYVE